MTKFLTGLITDETPILSLEPNNNITSEEKYKVLGIECSLAEKYINNMHYYDNMWYYFKSDDNNDGYPFYILDELMGVYLAKLRKLPTVSYQVATANDTYGLASVNFKNNEFEYYTLRQLINHPLLCTGTQNIEILRQFCVDTANESRFLEHLLNMLALDIHMLQKDRCSVNLQFQINKENNYFDIAPLYDYSNCSPKIDKAGLNIKTPIILINGISVRTLLKKYPDFQKYLTFCLERDMKEIWEQICLDYHFNQDCFQYERIKDYYAIKDESQKKYIKQILKDIK